MFDCRLVDLRQANRYYSYRCSKAWSAIRKGVTDVQGSMECPGGSAGVIEHLIEIRSELAGADGEAASSRLAELDAAAAVLDGLRLLAVSRVQESTIWRDDPNGTANSYLRSRHRRSHKESAADLRAAQSLVDFPQLREAVDSGAVSRSHVDVIVAIGLRNDTRARMLPDFLPAFIQIATHYPATTLRTVMRRWADQVDPLMTARDEDEAHQRRYLHVSQLADGVAVEGFFGRAQGATILAAMNAALSELHRSGSSTDEADKDHSDQGMPVSTSQQRADALVNLMDRVLAGGGLPAAGGSRATVTVLVPLSRLEQPCERPADHDTLKLQVAAHHHLDPRFLFATGSAEIGVSNGPGRDVISAQAAQRLTCDCEIHRIVLDPDGLPIDVGRKMRTFPTHMRKALEVRDQGCVFPGCSKPPGWADAHHIIHWAQGGKTSLDNAALLCSRHHHEVHANNHTVQVQPDGRATVTLNRRRL